MTREKTIKVYSFDELPPKIREKIVESTQRRLYEDLEPELITECFEQVLEEEGMPADDIRWRLSNCQGDGVAFYGTIDVSEYVKAQKDKQNFTQAEWDLISKADQDGQLSIKIEKSRAFHMYDHWNTMIVDMEMGEDYYDGKGKLIPPFDDLEEVIKTDIKNISHRLEDMGYKAIDDITSEAEALEAIKSSENEYDENGKVV